MLRFAMVSSPNNSKCISRAVVAPRNRGCSVASTLQQLPRRKFGLVFTMVCLLLAAFAHAASASSNTTVPSTAPMTNTTTTGEDGEITIGIDPTMSSQEKIALENELKTAFGVRDFDPYANAEDFDDIDDQPTSSKDIDPKLDPAIFISPEQSAGKKKGKLLNVDEDAYVRALRGARKDPSDDDEDSGAVQQQQEPAASSSESTTTEVAQKREQSAVPMSLVQQSAASAEAADLPPPAVVPPDAPTNGRGTVEGPIDETVSAGSTEDSDTNGNLMTEATVADSQDVESSGPLPNVARVEPIQPHNSMEDRPDITEAANTPSGEAQTNVADQREASQATGTKQPVGEEVVATSDASSGYPNYSGKLLLAAGIAITSLFSSRTTITHAIW